MKQRIKFLARNDATPRRYTYSATDSVRLAYKH